MTKQDSIKSSDLEKKILNKISKVLDERELLVKEIEKIFKKNISKKNLEGINTTTPELYISFEEYLSDRLLTEKEYDAIDKELKSILGTLKKSITLIKSCKIIRPVNVSMKWNGGNNKFKISFNNDHDFDPNI